MKRSMQNKRYTDHNYPTGSGAERHVDLAGYLAGGVGGDTAPVIGNMPRRRKTAPRRVERARSKGQALLIIALMMTVLIMFVGLGVDVGNMMGKRAKLQSAIDASALSAAQLLDSGTLTTTVTLKAYQMLEANGVPTNTLSTKLVEINRDLRQVRVRAVQRVDTFFMRVIPMWAQVEVSAEATADLNTFAELNLKPYGKPGVVNELMLQTWGPDSGRWGGDVYSPVYQTAGGQANSERGNQPYGYLFRVDIPAEFDNNYDSFTIQIFDPDTYNRQDHMLAPTATATRITCPTPPCFIPPTPVPNTPSAYDSIYFHCPSGGACTGNQQNYDNPALKLNGYVYPTPGPYPPGWNEPPWTTGRAAVWRVDEYRRPYNTSGGIGPPDNTYDASWPTETNFTLWHFDPRITSAFGVPSEMSDIVSSGVGVPVRNTYAVRESTLTDLAWYEPWEPIVLSDVSCLGRYGPGNFDCYERESTGGFYFYLYVRSSAGSSENDYDLRVGPVEENYANGYDCRSLAGWSITNPDVCYSNEQFYQQSRTNIGLPDWNDGGARIYAKRALPINLATGAGFPMLYTNVSKNAAGQVLAIKHFDQDCGGSNPPCGPASPSYQMQRCVNVNTTTACSTGNCEPCGSLLNPLCFDDLNGGNNAYYGPDNGWYCSGCPQPEQVTIPAESQADFDIFFGPNGECESSWLRLERNVSYNNDTTVWEMPFSRPRLIK